MSGIVNKQQSHHDISTTQKRLEIARYTARINFRPSSHTPTFDVVIRLSVKPDLPYYTRKITKKDPTDIGSPMNFAAEVPSSYDELYALRDAFKRLSTSKDTVSRSSKDSKKEHTKYQKASSIEDSVRMEGARLKNEAQSRKETAQDHCLSDGALNTLSMISSTRPALVGSYSFGPLSKALRHIPASKRPEVALELDEYFNQFEHEWADPLLY